MSKLNIKVKADPSTEEVSIKVGRYTETFSTRYKSSEEIRECIRWGLITAGVSLSDDTLDEFLRENRIIP